MDAFVNLALAAAATAGALLWLKNDQGADRDPIDLPGLLLVGVGLFSLVFGFSHAETTSWSDPFTIGSLVAGVILLVVFASFEPRTKYPLLPPRVVLNRTRGGSLLVMVFAGVGVFGVFLFLTYYLQATLGFSPVRTGIAFLPLIAVLAAVAQVSNRVLLPRFGPKPIVPIGLILDGAGSFGLHSVGLHSSYAVHVLPYLVVLGIGSGLSTRPPSAPARSDWSRRTPAWDRRLSTRHSRWGDPWDGAAQHVGCQRCDFLPGRAGADSGRYPSGGAPGDTTAFSGPPLPISPALSWPGWCYSPAAWRR